MKRRLTAYLLFCVVILLSFSGLRIRASGDTITDSEIKHLVVAANRLYWKYQDGIQSKVHGPVTTTKEAASKEARAVYSDSVADGAWMFQCSDRKRLTYSENPDGTITTKEFLAQNIRFFYLLSDYSSEAMFNAASTPETAVEFRNLTGDNRSATAEVKLYYHQGMEWDETPVWVSVQFIKSDDGWRISGGGLLYAFSDWYNEKLTYTPDYPLLGIGVVDMQEMIDRAMNSHHPEEYYTTKFHSYDDYYVDGSFFSQSQISADVRSCTFLFKNAKDGLIYSAEFSYDPDYVMFIDFYGENRHGAWFLTGGGWYDLATGKTDVAPYTGESGDFTESVFAMSVIAVLSLSFSTMVAVRRKRKTDRS